MSDKKKITNTVVGGRIRLFVAVTNHSYPEVNRRQYNLGMKQRVTITIIIIVSIKALNGNK